MNKIVLYSNKHKLDDNRVVELEAEALSNAGYEVIVYGRKANKEIKRKKTQLKICGNNFFTYIKQCIDENADLYIFHDPGMLHCAVLLRLMGKKCIFDSHENYEEKLKTRIPNKIPATKPFIRLIVKIWWIYEKICVFMLSAKICADRTVKKKYGRNTFLLPNMPSKLFFEDLPERDPNIKGFHLVYVGTMSWDRGLVETAEAIHHCKHNDIYFHIIGSTDEIELQKKLQSDPNVVWEGRVEWTKLKNYLVNADLGTVLLQPTEAYMYYTGENIVKLWEYMSVGLPVLISDFPALEQLNDSLRFGKNVKPDDIEDIAKAIDWFIDHPEECRKLGENGRRVVIKKFNAEHYTEGFIDFLDKLI